MESATAGPPSGAFEGTTTDGAYIVARRKRAARSTRRPTATIRPASSPPAAAGRNLARLAQGRALQRGSRQRHAAAGEHHRLAADLGHRRRHRSRAASGRRTSPAAARTITRRSPPSPPIARSERLTTEQTTDTSFATVGGQWTRLIGRATLIAGGGLPPHRVHGRGASLLGHERPDRAVLRRRHRAHHRRLCPRASIPARRHLHRRARGTLDEWSSRSPRTPRCRTSRSRSSARAPSVAWRQGTLCDAGRGVSRQSAADAERAAPRLPRRQRRHEPQSAARSRNAHRRRGRRPGVVDEGLGPRDRVLQQSRRRHLQHHAVEHADADHARAPQLGQDSRQRRGVRSRRAADAHARASTDSSSTRRATSAARWRLPRSRATRCRRCRRCREASA